MFRGYLDEVESRAVLPFREARAALHKLEHIDVLQVTIVGQEVEVLTGLEPWLKNIRFIQSSMWSFALSKAVSRLTGCWICLIPSGKEKLQPVKGNPFAT